MSDSVTLPFQSYEQTQNFYVEVYAENDYIFFSPVVTLMFDQASVWQFSQWFLNRKIEIKM